MSNIVTWTINSVNSETGEVIVNFTNGVKNNLVRYIWNSNDTQESFAERLNADAVMHKNQWEIVPIETQLATNLLNLSGDSESYNPSSNYTIEVL